MKEEHPLPPPPPTAQFVSHYTSNIKVVLLNDHCVPEVGVVSKGKY